MPRKSAISNKFVTVREFKDMKEEFLLRFDRIEKNMATKDDIKNMATKDDIKNMATKDDIKNMATKDDIKNMATKDDIKNMATKDDIKNMATKDDIKNMATKDDIARLTKVIIKHSEDIEYIKQTMARNEDIQRIISTLDTLIARTEEHERKSLTNTYRINELETKFENHETRIASLEGRITK